MPKALDLNTPSLTLETLKTYKPLHPYGVSDSKAAPVLDPHYPKLHRMEALI